MAYPSYAYHLVINSVKSIRKNAEIRKQEQEVVTCLQRLKFFFSLGDVISITLTSETNILSYTREGIKTCFVEAFSTVDLLWIQITNKSL